MLIGLIYTDNGMKTRKSILKRFKITRTGKILRRPTGQDHLGSKKSGKKIRQRKGWVPLSKAESKVMRRLL